MPKVTLKGYITIPESDLKPITTELPNHCALTLQEPGCLEFKVTQDKCNPLRFDVYEEFIDAEAFELHQARVKTSTWGHVSRSAQRHYNITSESD